jgi:hypothetical protein
VITDPWLIVVLSSLIWVPVALTINRDQVRKGKPLSRSNVIATAATVVIALILYFVVVIMRWLS